MLLGERSTSAGTPNWETWLLHSTEVGCGANWVASACYHRHAMDVEGFSPSSEERLLAGLSHLFGFLIALIIWFVQKDRSPFLRFQALQALAFDVVIIGTMVVFSILFSIVVTVLTVATAAFASSADDAAIVAGIIGGLFVIVSLIGMFATIIYTGVTLVGRLVAAISTFQGNDYHHPWLGRRVENYLSS